MLELDCHAGRAFGDREEVLPVVGVNAAGAATVQLDTSTDGGSTWTVASAVPFQAQVLPPISVVPTTVGPTYQKQVTLSVTEDGAWWLTLPAVSPTTDVSTDQGRTWATLNQTGLPADARSIPTIGPAGVAANAVITPINATSALVTAAASTTSTAAHTAYYTVDRGRTWTPVHLPSD